MKWYGRINDVMSKAVSRWDYERIAVELAEQGSDASEADLLHDR